MKVPVLLALGIWPIALAAQQPVTHGELPSVSPDGSLIAFLSDRTGRSNVFVIGVDGSGERQVSQTGAGTPRFSMECRLVSRWPPHRLHLRGLESRAAGACGERRWIRRPRGDAHR